MSDPGKGVIDPVGAVRPDRLVDGAKVYYGWIVLGVGAFAMVMTSPGQTYAVSAFVDQYLEAMSLGRGLVSSLYTGGTLTAALFLPLIGRMVDRHGARLVMVVVVSALAVVCLYMSVVRGAVMLFIGFVGLRLFGQGGLSLVAKNVVAQWWVRRRGMAMGIVGTASALLGSGGFPNLINALIPAVGWRGTYVILASMLAALMIPLAAIFVRDTPEAHGLLPDGGDRVRKAGNAPDRSEDRIEDNWTLAEASRTGAFWIVNAGLALQSAVMTGITFHLFSIFAERGLDSTVAAAAFLPMAITGALVMLGSGVLVDHISPRFLLSAALALQALVLVLATLLSSPALAIAFALTVGISGGMERTVANVIWPAYFGRRHLGTITGVTTTVMVAASAFGPMPIGIAYDLIGSYTPILLAASPVPLLLALGALFYGRKPTRRANEAGTERSPGGDQQQQSDADDHR